MNINWYPGHMAKTKKLLTENLKLVDVIVELMDARIPSSSQNPDFDSLFHGKRRIRCLNKADLADPRVSREWKEYFNKNSIDCVFLDSRTGQGMKELLSAIETAMEDKFLRDEARGLRRRPVRAMVTGIPNVGKSTLITSVTHAKSKISDYPYTTWEPIPGMMPYENVQIQLIDTPALSKEHIESELMNLVKTTDLVLLMVDIQGFPIQQLEDCIDILHSQRIVLTYDQQTIENERMIYLPHILIVNKTDDNK